MSIGLHTPRCEIFLGDLVTEKASWSTLDVQMMSSDHVLGTFRPAYKTMYRNLETVPAFGNTAVDEE